MDMKTGEHIKVRDYPLDTGMRIGAESDQCLSGKYYIGSFAASGRL